MSACCMIADQIIQIADGGLRRLLFDFLLPDNVWVDPQRILCRVNVGNATHVHGIRSLHASHPVAHTFTNDLDPFGLLLTDENYENMTVFNRREEKLVDTMLVGVYSCLIPHRTVFVHAALIGLAGYGGILFVGDSGVGKTTQAQLWAQYRGATIMNGDKVFLALRSDVPEKILAYGSPWTGSSSYRVNTRVPLRAIVSLVRRESRAIRLLSDSEAMRAFVPRIYMPGWDDRLIETVMDTLDAMLPLVPVYEMSCLPDASAVEMLERVLLNES